MAEVKDLEQATPATEPAAAAEAAPKGGWAAKWKDMPKKKRRRLIRRIIALVILIAAAVGAWWFFLRDDGADMTEAFERGARLALELTLRHGCRAAVVKSRSPSCGAGRVYDGSFSGVLCEGDGLWTRLLRRHGVRVMTEEEFDGAGILAEDDANMTESRENAFAK